MFGGLEKWLRCEKIAVVKVLIDIRFLKCKRSRNCKLGYTQFENEKNRFV